MKTKTTKSIARRRLVPERSAATPVIPVRKRVGDASEEITALGGIKSILVPIDFSAPSNKSFVYAAQLAKTFGAKVTLLHVLEPVATPDFAKTFPLLMENDRVMANCKKQLEQLIVREAISPELVEKVIVRPGRSFLEIADAARTLKVDLIIIATHGYTGLKHAFLGSTAERVVRYATCPVLVLRGNEK